MTKIRLSRKAIADLDGIWEIYGAIQGLNNLPVFLEKRYDVIKPGLFGLKVGHHIIFYKKGNNGSISVDRILHERMDYERHL